MRHLIGRVIGRASLLAFASLAAATIGNAAPATLANAIAAAERSGFSGQIVVADATRVLTDYRSKGARSPLASGLWPWGSVSKQVTAALVMAEVDAGRLSLDDTVTSRLPDFTNAYSGRATIRQLLQHTSGLPNPNATPLVGDTQSFYLRDSRSAGGTADATGFCAGPPAAAPGAGFSHNNCDTIVAAAILERVSGKPYAALLRGAISQAFGLSTLRLARPGERAANAERLATYGAGGALIGSARDLVRFDQALLARQLVSAGGTETMWRGEPALGYVALGAWGFTAPLAGCKASVRLVERRGAVGGVQVRNVIAPDLGRILVAFTPRADLDFGEVWQGRGISYDLLSAAFCG